MGMFALPRIGCKQDPQRDPGHRMLLSSGSLAATTFSKLPMQAPTQKTNASQKTSIQMNSMRSR